MASRWRWFRLSRKPKTAQALADVFDDEDDDYDPLAADSEYIHEIAHDYGVTPSGEPLPRHTDKQGRVWVTCNCGKKFLLRSEHEDSEGNRPE